MPERTSASLSHQDPEAANSFRLLSARRKRPTHRSAANERLLAATMQQLTCLLLCRLNRHKSHGRAPNRLANRFRIGGVVLVALDVRFTYCVMNPRRFRCPKCIRLP